MTTKLTPELFETVSATAKAAADKQSNRYKPAEIESKWQQVWGEQGIYPPDLKKAKKPYYNLMMFPYPSAEGLHVGNMYAFTGVDVHGRFQRMKGYDVFEPIGLDGFGIHSENYALKVNRHPKEQVKISAANFYRQLRATGNMFDWTRTLETYDPDYYRWTQWLFVEMFKHGLAYRAKALVNWCPTCKTVLADEQVVNGCCERTGDVVEKKELEQWFFRITAYAERLLQNTYKPAFNWSEKVKLGQRNWIGKKEGVNIVYKIKGLDESVTCFTTAPVNFGMTFVVISPEHRLVKRILDRKIYIPIERYKEVKTYVNVALKKNYGERLSQGREKTGVFTGLCVINPVNKKEVPVWVADFVLKEVGTGAVQGCPGHDYKDFEFARKFRIPIPRVVIGPDGDVSEIDTLEKVIVSGMRGKMINSDFLDGMEFSDALQATMDYFEKKGWGKRVVSYHLRDWLISRQRYWGAPIPMVYCQKCAEEGKSWFTFSRSHPGGSGATDRIPHSKKVDSIASLQNDNNNVDGDNKWAVGWYPVPEDQLPVLLPDVKDWKPTGTGRGPLAGHPEFYKTTCPHCGAPAERETDVCDTFLDSSWYYLRYPFVEKQSHRVISSKARNPAKRIGTSALGGLDFSPSSGWVRNDQSAIQSKLPWDNEITKKWFPVDSYIGGAEHTVLHLLYTRFVWMALRDWGYLEIEESKDGSYDPDEPFKRFYAHGLIIKDGAKMSKSKGNVVVPDEYIKLYGADTLRTYLIFLGPFDHGGDFRDSGIAGMYKWLSRVWRLSRESAKKISNKSVPDSSEGLKMIHKMIKDVTQNLERFRYNTAISKFMEFTNWWMNHPDKVNRKIAEDFLKLLAPFAPHMTEELWQQLKVEQVDKVEKGNQPVSTSSTSSTLSTYSTFNSIHTQPWPIYDPTLIIEDTVSVVVQVNGKVRDLVDISVQEANQQQLVEQITSSSAKVSKWLGDKAIKKTIFVPQKLINFVV